jgi:hypothetical protein
MLTGLHCVTEGRKRLNRTGSSIFLPMQELQELQTAANGGPVEKARYFERCTARRLQSLSTAQPVEYKPFTWEQKRKLSQACVCLGEETCSAILSIVSESSQLPSERNGVVSVRLDDLPDSILYRIQVRLKHLRLLNRAALPLRNLRTVLV